MRIAYARSRSCLYLGLEALGLGRVAVPGRPMLGDVQREANPKRGVSLVARSCGFMSALPTNRSPKSARVPAALACTVLGDAYALGVITYNPARAETAYTTACETELEARSEGDAASMAFEHRGPEFRGACQAFRTPTGVYLTDAHWAEVGRSRVQAAKADKERLRLEAEAHKEHLRLEAEDQQLKTQRTVYEKHLGELRGGLANLTPAQRVAAVQNALLLTQVSAETKAALGAPVLGPILQDALVQLASRKGYAPVGEATRDLLVSAPASDARWSELRGALARFRSDAAAYFLKKSNGAGSHAAAAAMYLALAVQFGAQPQNAPDVKRRFVDATNLTAELPPLKGDCAFLSPRGITPSPTGPRILAAVAIDACNKTERRFTSDDPYTEDVEESHTSLGQKRRQTMTRTVPDCRTVLIQTCTGKESFSCYTSGSRQECNGTRTETYEVDVDAVPITTKSTTKRSGVRATAHHTYDLDVRGRVTGRLATVSGPSRSRSRSPSTAGRRTRPSRRAPPARSTSS